jgi:integrase
MRVAEIASLRVRNVRTLPTITWTGKGSKPRTMSAGARLADALQTYLDAYPDVTDDDPLICRLVLGASRQGGQPRIAWHTASSNRALFDLITKRSRTCGLGHVAPHDLRRSAAGILHRATNADGAHHFDLLDIQKVLGHSDPATTMRSYLAPMDTDVYDRAASVLD